MMYTQKQIYDYLLANPLHTEVFVGDVKNLNSGDYIFLDYTNDALMASDNRGDYQSYIQITVATKRFDNRKLLVKYIKDFLNVTVTYEKDIDFEYFIGRCECGVLIHEDD